jgi:bacterioferritin-associated ferredoxin
MDLDDDVCLCFRVSLRKLRKYVRLHKPIVPSLLSECNSAGTGCMWCVPILEKIWKDESLENLTAEDHAAGRATYRERGNVREGHD